MAMHEDTLVELIKEHKIKEVICTGHSLDGGVTQVTHFMLA